MVIISNESGGKMTSTTFEPVKKEDLTSKEFAELMKSNLASNVVSSKYILGKIGTDNFGKFRVEYKTPVLR